MEEIEEKWKKLRRNGNNCGGMEKLRRNGKN